MVTLMYSSGVRVGEVCRLKYSDIQRSSMRIHVAQTKNRSDRYALLSQKAVSYTHLDVYKRQGLHTLEAS